MKITENPVKCKEAMAQLGIARTRMAALKSALGIRHARYVFMSDLRKFMRDNPTFSTTDIYPKERQSRRARPQRGASGKSGGQSLRRGRGNGGPSLREHSFSQAPSQR